MAAASPGSGFWVLRRRAGQAGRTSSSLVTAISVAAIVLAIAYFVVDRPGDDAVNEAATEPSTSAADQQPAAGSGGPSDRSGTDQGKQADQRAGANVAKHGDKKDKPQSADDAVPDVYVEVYNNSAISGLAATRSAQLRDAGWQVVGVDNWRGVIPASTVYYPTGMAEQADRLAQELGISRTHAAVAPMKFDRLTVILTADAG